jgi:hypothetical protein
MEYDSRAQSAVRTPGSSSYLADLESNLSTIRNSAADISARLQQAGFYGPPEEASSAAGLPPTENNVRSRIVDEVRYLRSVIATLDHQTRSIVD